MRPCNCGNCDRCTLYDTNPDVRKWYDAEGDTAAQAAIVERVADQYQQHMTARPDVPPCDGCLGKEGG